MLIRVSSQETVLSYLHGSWSGKTPASEPTKKKRSLQAHLDKRLDHGITLAKRETSRDDNEEELRPTRRKEEDEGQGNTNSETTIPQLVSAREVVAKQHRVKGAKRPKKQTTSPRGRGRDGEEELSAEDIFYRTQTLWNRSKREVRKIQALIVERRLFPCRRSPEIWKLSLPQTKPSRKRRNTPRSEKNNENYPYPTRTT